MCISDVLMRGEENAMTGKEICKILDISIRDLTASVEQERREGKPICASVKKPFGYFLAATKDEMHRYCRSLKHRADEIHKTRIACTKTMEGLPD